MKETGFTTNMKLSDLLISNPQLILMLPRFGIGLGFGDKRVVDICKKHNVSASLFILICNIYTFDEYTPSIDQILDIDGNSLIKYLQTSHRYYLEKRLDHIGKHIERIAAQCGDSGPLLINFFSDYKNEVASHFQKEEECTFPYISALLENKKPSDYSIDDYVKEHDNIEDKLNDLINIIVKYLPEEILPDERISVWFDLVQVAADLNKHAKIENTILVPFVRIIENRIR
jgi:regulator of cell morphogenesis and NO signaling